jgi:hypothetical protein
MPRQGRLEYQRIIVGYHGCDQETAEEVLHNGEHLKPSDNDYDWLGEGIYFWEFAPRRALQFAGEKRDKRQKIKSPTVLGAYINLGRCFDLTDTEHTRQISEAFDRWREPYDKADVPMPENKSLGSDYDDLILRYRDCAVINWYMTEIMDNQADGEYFFQTVRGVFEEGGPAFEGSAIQKKAHAQVAVRDPECIMGYFLPTTFFDEGVNHE